MVKGAPSKYGRRAFGLGVLWLATLAAPAVSRAQQVEVPDFIVGYPTADVSVAVGADGNMAFVWYEYGYGPPADDLGWARAFSASGAPLSDAVRVDLGGRFETPNIAALPGGGYIVSSRYHNTNNNHHVLGRFLDAAAAPSSAPFQVELDGSDLASASVTAIASGPVFFWHQDYPWMRRFGFAGQPLANPVHVDEDSSTYSIALDVAPLPNGGFVTAWFDYTRQVTRFRIYGANGLPTTPIGEIPTFYFHHVAAGANGIALSGFYYHELSVHRFGLDGQPIGSEIVLHEGGYGAVSDLEYDTAGNLYVVWSPQDQNTSLPIRVDVFGADGFKLVPTTIVASSPASDLRTARLANGFFVNVWSYGFNSTAYANVVSICGVQQACGNGVVDNACEQCDQGAANSDTQPDACRTSCKPAACGDGVTDSGEECDDANHIDGDGCDVQCRVEICGNGRIEGGEGCDDSNLVDGDGCDSNCRATACGNGVLTAGEECDDGNTTNGDDCDQNCLIEACGNTRVENGEECDDGNLLDGDGCDSNCDNTRCGNGIVTVGEECDDDNSTDGDGCDRLCRIEDCGNERVEGNETCDDGNLVDGDGCQANCLLTPRVDTVLEPVRPVRVVLSSSATSATKVVRLAVRNADLEGLQILRLQAVGGTCPAGAIAAAPDFDSRIAGTQDAVALLPGQRASARMAIQITRGTFTAVDRDAPFRCSVDLEVKPASGGAIDDTPANGHFSVDVEVFDRAAPDTSAEAYLQALKPVAIHIPRGALSRGRSLRVRALSLQSGGTFAFAASDGDCPVGTVTLTSQDAAGTAVLDLRASRAFITTPKRFSPHRCTASITSTPSSDVDAGNNTMLIPIDIRDDNDVE